MKIIDENGAAIENPDLTLGYLVDDTEPVEHPAVEGVEGSEPLRDRNGVSPAAEGCAGRSSTWRACLREP